MFSLLCFLGAGCSGYCVFRVLGVQVMTVQAAAVFRGFRVLSIQGAVCSRCSGYLGCSGCWVFRVCVFRVLGVQGFQGAGCSGCCLFRVFRVLGVQGV